MTPSLPPQDLAAQWTTARKLYPLYVELAREFVIDLPPCADFESGEEQPDREGVESAVEWLTQMDKAIQVYQLRQFLQTSALGDQQCMLALLQHFLAQPAKDGSARDKVDFLLVQYFSQVAPSRLDDNDVDVAYVAQSLEPVLGEVDLKAPVWLNALERVIDSARRCRSLNELLHGGVLEQGRKVKTQAGDLFFLPIALVAFTRFGYLMRRVFFRLMHDDLNAIVDGLDQLEEQGIAMLDCRRAQFSAKEPIVRLRMICQSWKVMFQAEYSSGQPLRMLVDLRASVADALAGNVAAESGGTSPAPVPAAKAAAAPAGASFNRSESAPKSMPLAQPAVARSPAAPKIEAKSEADDSSPREFEVSGAPEWDPDSASPPGKQK
jgi:hypothetical protein